MFQTVKLSHRTPEARAAYVQGYMAAMDAAVARLVSMADECSGGEGAGADNPYMIAASAIQRITPKGEIVESFELR